MSLLLPAALAGLLKLLEEARRAFAIQRAHDVAFSLFLVEFDGEPLTAELRGFRPFVGRLM